MGISGLLPQLRSITRRKHIADYSKKTIAVDGYVWLHKGAYSCARELVEGEPTDKYVSYCMGRVDLLLRHGVVPFVLFDGGPLPIKSEEEESRARSRAENREKARALWRQGNRVAALEFYQKAADVTAEMAYTVMVALKQRNIRCMVAPYEADAQMAYLALNGLVDAVMTEDSDLLTYGCPTVLFKFDSSGFVDEISLADLPQCRELNFTGWTHDLFQQMCVMAGCDFCSGLNGIGIKKAHAQIRRTRDFTRALRALRFDGVQVPAGYEIRFQRALWTFRHQRVYCPRRRELVMLHAPPGGSLAAQALVLAAAELVDGEPDFLGPLLPVHIGQGIAEGRLHPVTHQLYNGVQLSSYSNGPSSNKQGCGGGSSAQAIDDPLDAHVPVEISVQARQSFKKPRIAAPSDSEPSQPSQPQQQRPAARPIRPNLPAALTAQRYFSSKSSIGANLGGAPAVVAGGETLRTHLQAALLAWNNNKNEGAEVVENDNQVGVEQEDSLDGKFNQILDELDGIEDGTMDAAEAGPKNAVNGGKLGNVLWRPRACWRTPGQKQSDLASKPFLGSGGAAAASGMALPKETPHQPLPAANGLGQDTDTPGFYAADTPLDGFDDSGGVCNTDNPQGLDSALQQREDNVHKSKLGNIDLSHLPEVRKEALAAIEAVVEEGKEARKQRSKAIAAADREEPPVAEKAATRASLFEKFACKK